MKQIGFILLSIILVFSMTAVSYAEGNQREGRNGGDMLLLNQGIAYLTGEGAEQDYGKAFEFFEQAYEANNRKAARYLGMIYEQGLGVEQDYIRKGEDYMNNYFVSRYGAIRDVDFSPILESLIPGNEMAQDA